ncbi:hypothetical protein [Paracoccus actinidiae]|uniref:hypothetical protein n=1 Tax=Paracoccus actinidiae TaxID=3064531 RepID=UPI0027D26BB4|nr:hypothetical protein [Paracoccus sp. M09]
MAEAGGLRLIIDSYNLRHGISSEEGQNDALHLVGDRPDSDQGENRSPPEQNQAACSKSSDGQFSSSWDRCLSKELSADFMRRL